MSSTIPAIAGRIGTTDYWVTTMKAKEVCEKLVIPKEMEGWADLSLEESYQRDINLNRVKREVAPYFANDPDRFTGSLIVAIQNDKELSFERFNDVAKGMPELYKKAASGLGFLTLDGGEVLVPLDGQHRAKAIKYAISGRDDSNRDLNGISGNKDLAYEDIVVILVRYDATSSRKIFNKVNRYARPTTKGQNLITDDDDVVAVIVRRSIVGELIDARLVERNSSSLNSKALQFTTLSTLYDASVAALKFGGHKWKASKRPDEAKETLMRNELVAVWTAMLDGVETMRMAIDDDCETGDQKRMEIRRDSILGKPIGQLAAVRAMMTLRHDARFGGATLTEIARRLNRVPWSVKENIWQGVLMSGTKMKGGKTAAVLAGDLIAYLLEGQHLSREEKDKLRDRIVTNLSEQEAENYRLPEPIGL